MSFAVQLRAEPVDEIMKKVDFMVRKSYETQISKAVMTTCRYRVNQGKMSCIDQPREIVVDNARKISNAGDVHARSIAFIEKPISDKGIGLLTWEYEAIGKENDSWLYLSVMGKTNRIVADGDDSGSVFGTEFSVENTENPEARKYWEYSYKILEDISYKNRPVWVIEILPTDEKAKKTRYTKIISWIDKERYVPLKENYFREGKIHKQRTQRNVKKIDGIWVPLKVTMNNLTSDRVSFMDMRMMKFNIKVNDEFLSKRAFSDFAFRERNLETYRGQY